MDALHVESVIKKPTIMPRDNLYPYALTTLQRVKDRLFDTNSVITLTGTTNATVTISGITFPTNTTPPGISIGQAIYGSGIPFGAYITAIDTNTLTLSLPATSSATITLTISNQPTNFDNLLIRGINYMTDWIERECGNRRFAQTLYNHEVYSAYGAKQRYLITKQCPVSYFTSQGDMTANSPVIVNIPNTAGFKLGMPIINCPNTPPGIITHILSVDSPTQITLDQNCGQTISQEIFQVNGLLSFEWRAGTPNAPSWTQFVPDQFELVEDGKAGVIRLYGIMPRLYNNMARVTYYAGYQINWANAGDGITHTLPADITSACENTIVRYFKRRDLAGKTSESLDGATVAWDRDIDMQDKEAIQHYRMTPAFY